MTGQSWDVLGVSLRDELGVPELLGRPGTRGQLVTRPGASAALLGAAGTSWDVCSGTRNTEREDSNADMGRT